MLNANYWLLFVIIAPMLWGTANVLDAALRRYFINNDFALTWIFTVTRLPFIILFFVLGDLKMPDVLSTIMMLASGIFWTMAVVLYFESLNREEPTRVALIMQTIPVFTLLIAFFAIDERLNIIQAIGFILLMASGILAALKKSFFGWKTSKALFIMIVASVLWSISDVLFKKYEPAFGNFSSAFATYFLGSFLYSFSIIYKMRNKKGTFSYFKKLPLRAWMMIFISLIIGVIGTLSFAFALTVGKASLASVISGVQPLFTLFAGIVLANIIKEVHREKLKGSAIIIKSVSLILVIGGLILLQISH
jgi:drug/metabolite transporter (DMT)-like permease